MSDREVPGRGRPSEPGEPGFDAVEHLRRKLEGMKAAEAGASEAGKPIRLPRRPRRTSEEPGERARKTWRSEGSGSVYDPAPTRPVLRSELQRETGWWQAGPDSAWLPTVQPDPAGAEQDGSVIDFGAARRKRAGADGPARGGRRMAKPRRIGSAAGSGSDGDQDDGRPDDTDSPEPNGPGPRR
ncbi:hypothetical protein IU501_10030 [Nocardia otitidiscaviarum]|uniref:hypothetical protein n=1 Tax=Nocardia otitidiscaviarum TaxID=1823 RepID=UPI0011DE1319|nr:hypothetical protein [Nocardia otitidiscaviarum]MBF6133336.1 hypothetical protein [Nocardia otitidiscaviarum]MBF6486732.1 hypothetical protein [Nocardia otitidiscaviarum]